MVQETALAEHQQMTEAANAVAECLDLIVDVIRCAGKAGAAFDQLLDRSSRLFDRIAVPVPDKAAALAARFEHCDVGGKRVVAGWVGERLGDGRGSPSSQAWISV